MRKLFAAVAAAATLIGGMVLSASSAQADGVAAGTTITVNNPQVGHTYTAYKFANFTSVTAGEGANGSKIAHVEITTESAWVNVVTAAAEAATGASIPAEYTQNPAAYVATFDAATLREFADALTIPTGTSAAGTPLSGTTEGAASGTISGLTASSWYLVKDTVKSNNNDVQGGPEAIVATQIIDGNGVTYGEFVNGLKADAKQNAITAMGEFNAKATVPSAPVKTVTSLTDCAANNNTNTKCTVRVGQTLSYNVTAKVPTDYASYDAYTFTFTDTPGTGLTVSSANIKVNGTKVSAVSGITITGFTNGDLVGNGSAAFTVILSKTALDTVLNGKTATNNYYDIELTYDAVVNESAENTVTNTTTVTDPSGTSEPGKVEKNVGQFSIKKVGKDDNGGWTTALAGAEFSIIPTEDDTARRYDANATAETATALKFTEITGDNKGSYTLNADQSATSGVTSALATSSDSNNKGQLKLNGLAQGTYTVKETKAPAGYSSQFLPTFTVTVNADGTVTFSDLGNLDLVAGDATAKTATVRNVKSLTQLPLTGGAGIILFSVIAALLVAVAAIATVRIRAVKRELQA